MRLTSKFTQADWTKQKELDDNHADLIGQVTKIDPTTYTEARLAELWQQARWQSGINVKWVESA